MRQLRLGPLVFCLVLAAGPVGAQDDEIARCIRDLASPNWEDRNRAVQKLEDRGLEAWPYLLRARSDPDAEVARLASSTIAGGLERIVDAALEDEYLRIALRDALGAKCYGNPELEAKAVGEARAILLDPAQMAAHSDELAEAIDRVGPVPATWALTIAWSLLEPSSLREEAWEAHPLVGLALREPEGLIEACDVLRAPALALADFVLRTLAMPPPLAPWLAQSVPRPLAPWLAQTVFASSDEALRRRFLLANAPPADPDLLDAIAAVTPLSMAEAELLLAIKARLGDEEALRTGLTRFAEIGDETARQRILIAALIAPERPLPSGVLEIALSDSDALRWLAAALVVRLGDAVERDRLRERLGPRPPESDTFEDDGAAAVRAFHALLDVAAGDPVFQAWSIFEDATLFRGFFFEADPKVGWEPGAALGALVLFGKQAGPQEWRTLCDRLQLRGAFALSEELEALPIGTSETLDWFLRKGDSVVKTRVPLAASGSPAMLWATSYDVVWRGDGVPEARESVQHDGALVLALGREEGAAGGQLG